MRVRILAANTSAINVGAVQAELSPRQARTIAMNLLKAAQDAEDQRAYNLKRAQAAIADGQDAQHIIDANQFTPGELANTDAWDRV